VDAIHERLIERAASIDELLSDAFEPVPGGEDAAALAERRLAAWCQSATSGDWPLFERRLARDGLSIARVRGRLAAVRRSASAAPPPWLADAVWIEAALQSDGKTARPGAEPAGREAIAFEQVFMPVLEQAESRLWPGLDARVFDTLSEAARADLCRSLLKELSELATPALYERFVKARKAGAAARYDQFVAAMQAGGFRLLFDEKPVLLRLMAVLVRQWVETSREFVRRLDADLAAIRRHLLPSGAVGRVAGIEDELSDRHNGGRSVKIIRFEDGARIVYKPKDLRLDVAWHALIERLNRAGLPLALRAVRALAHDGYGWTEFIAHAGCADAAGGKRFFRRAGAWLALFHCFVTTDMHQENMIAAGDHPVPIDLETILQASAEEYKANDDAGAAFDAAMEIIGNAVMTVGLLPAYGRGAFNDVFAMGGLTADWDARTVVRWDDINTDAMRPVKVKEVGRVNPNLPHVNGRYERLSDHIEDFVSGFADYAKFLARWRSDAKAQALFEGFTGLPVRKVIHPTRFYYMLLQRLKNHRRMDDGALWSAQADFVARLAEWEKDADPLWPLLQKERAALLTLNVPHFIMRSDGDVVGDATGVAARTEATTGMDRARTRLAGLDDAEIDWQVEAIRANTNSAAPVTAGVSHLEESLPTDSAIVPAKEIFIAEAGNIAAELSRHAIRRGPGAAWIGLDWLGDADVVQLVCLGPDLYNGASGIALFLAAHAALTRSKSSGELALAALSHLRDTLKGRNAARAARALGIGGATGLGSIVYALAVMAKCLHDDDLLADAQGAARLFTDGLIAADKQFDVMGGSAGAILALLRLYRDTQSGEVLRRATACGEHLLAQSRLGAPGFRTWIGQGFGAQGLNGMSHGAAGFAYALAALAAATGREEFAGAAAECIAFEDKSYDAERHNWPDLRGVGGGGEPHWPCQWCHGALGIGLARLAIAKGGGAGARLDPALLTTDIRNAVEGAERGRPTPVDTLCCGTLGGVEFFCEAGDALSRDDLRELGARRLAAILLRAGAAGDYRWNSGKRQFNLGLFRGLAGVGYTLLRRVDTSLPNVLIWE